MTRELEWMEEDGMWMTPEILGFTYIILKIPDKEPPYNFEFLIKHADSRPFGATFYSFEDAKSICQSHHDATARLWNLKN